MSGGQSPPSTSAPTPSVSTDAAARSATPSSSNRRTSHGANSAGPSLLPRSSAAAAHNAASSSSSSSTPSGANTPTAASTSPSVAHRSAATNSPRRALATPTSSNYRIQSIATTDANAAPSAGLPHVAPSSATPAMFGSYSGGPPSLFTIGGGGGGSSGAPSAPTTRPATNLGFWRAPHRTTNAQREQMQREQLQRFWSPQMNPHRQAQRWLPPATADPAGWAGNLTTSRLTGSGFQEHTLLSFSWLIKDLRLLRDEVEHSPTSSLNDEAGRSVSAGAGRSEVWTTQPLFGDGKWKLELVRTAREGTTVLSAYLTSMVVESNPSDVSLSASVMLGIRLPSAQPSTSSAGWVWSHFTHFTFDRDAEYYECHELPSLSELLDQHADVARANCFELVVQLGTGPNLAIPSEDAATRRLPFQLPESRLVPESIVAGLEGMVDCALTGDVALIVRERGVVLREGDEEVVGEDFEVLPWAVGRAMPGEEQGDGAEGVAGHSHGHSEGSSSSEGRTAEVVVRDRVIWAHSSILRSRSEYFRTMLESGFSEGSLLNSGGGEDTMASYGGRTVRVLRIPDADYATAFALIRYFYVGEIDFMEDEDVRSVTFDDEWVAAIGSGASTSGSDSPPVWEWRSLAQIAGGGDEEQQQHYRMQDARASTLSGRRSWGTLGPKRSTSSTSHDHTDGASTPRRRSGSSASSQVDPKGKGKAKEEASSQSNPTSPLATTSSPTLLATLLRTDPHSHPPTPRTRASPTASSLAIYKLAHRFHQTTLSSLAQSHLLANLDPTRNAFPALLATHLYPGLHAAVRDAVLDSWGEVSESKEFERCCDEVGKGEWGPLAGRAIRGFMRALAGDGSGAAGSGAAGSGGRGDGSRGGLMGRMG